jgi:hypothetical protein
LIRQVEIISRRRRARKLRVKVAAGVSAEKISVASPAATVLQKQPNAFLNRASMLSHNTSG